jgi:hypothetical protein
MEGDDRFLQEDDLDPNFEKLYDLVQADPLRYKVLLKDDPMPLPTDEELQILLASLVSRALSVRASAQVASGSLLATRQERL